jgi:hypothetical protein
MKIKCSNNKNDEKEYKCKLNVDVWIQSGCNDNIEHTITRCPQEMKRHALGKWELWCHGKNSSKIKGLKSLGSFLKYQICPYDLVINNSHQC